MLDMLHVIFVQIIVVLSLGCDKCDKLSFERVEYFICALVITNLNKTMAEKGMSLYKGSDALYDYVCSSCYEDGLNTEAKHFCRDCEECFCDKCVSYHNKALRKHTVLGRRDVSQWAAVSSKVDASVRCDHHQTKPLELYCEDHGQLCCHICVSTDHR